MNLRLVANIVEGLVAAAVVVFVVLLFTNDPTPPPAAKAEAVAAAGGVDGAAIFGPKRSGLSFTPPEREALTLAASYLGSSLQLAERHQVQASALAVLRAERVDVQSRGSALSEALADASSPPPGLHVFALGSLRAELNGGCLHMLW